MDKTSFSETEKRPQNPNTKAKDSPAQGHDARDAVGAAIAQLGKVKRAGMSIRDEVEAYVYREPLAAVAIAAGTGFALGSLFGSRLGRLALVAAVGYAAQEVIEGALGEGGIRRILVEELSKHASAKDARTASSS